MNDLINQNIEHLYNSDDNNIVEEFYYKCLLCSKLYKRAVPYFSSKILIVLDKGLKKFIENGGKIKLLVSSNLLSMDIDAINKGYRNKRNLEYSKEIRDFDIHNRYKNEHDYLSWLVYKGILDIKIISNKNNKSLGIYHGKIGIFEDFYNNKVAFNGSMNETLHALKFNYEYINIYHSWTSKTQVECMNETFDNLWNEYCKKENCSKNQPLGVKLDRLFDYFKYLRDAFKVIRVYGRYVKTPYIRFIPYDKDSETCEPIYHVKCIYVVKDYEYIINRELMEVV